MAIVDKKSLLQGGELRVTGRLVDASNATLYATSVLNSTQMLCIYKPVAGERPLWDFSEGSLAHREYAAYLVSSEIGFDLVPLTVLRDGPYGFGMAQEWITIDESIDLATFFATDHPRLRLMAIFDAIINNTDRKIGHLLPINSETVFGCDHGITFHVDDKLRTVLWQWAEVSFTDAEIILLKRAYDLMSRELGQTLGQYLTQDEIQATLFRIKRLLKTAHFPLPNPNWPAVPWPAF